MAVVQEIAPILSDLNLGKEAAEILRWAVKVGSQEDISLSDMASLHEVLAETLHSSGENLEEALSHYQTSLHLAERSFGAESCEVALVVNNMSNLIGEGPQAVSLAKRGLEISQKRCEEYLSLSYLNLGRSLVSLFFLTKG